MSDFDEFGALSFDCYGTLIDWEAGIAPELVAWAAAHDLDLSVDELLAVFAEFEAGVERDHRTRRYPDVLAATLELIAARFGINASAAECADFGGSVGRWPAFADSADALARLKQRYRLIILSNVDRTSFEASNEKLGVEFDLVLTAQDIGSYKPDRANFTALVDRLGRVGVAANELLHVAQSLFHDHEPAKAMGLSTVWIDRRHGQQGFGATPPPAAAVIPDWTFPSMQAFADAALAEG